MGVATTLFWAMVIYPNAGLPDQENDVHFYTRASASFSLPPSFPFSYQ